jgi:hypothetical protein
VTGSNNSLIDNFFSIIISVYIFPSTQSILGVYVLIAKNLGIPTIIIGSGVGKTLEELVVYKALYNSPEFGQNAFWVRPAKMFMEKVIIEGIEKSRFEYIA